MHLKYRADIDGLRAIAVLVVIFFHANIPGFSGGFVGVDIFFVISGFLITSVIHNEIENDNFSISKFYERRIRRIFPALVPVIIFTLIVGSYGFNFRAFKALGQSVTATTLFSSNILFWLTGGYFATSSLQKPLLHTWSLAVEEQFYLFFPLLLLLVSRFKKKRYIQWFVVIGLLSLITSILAVNINRETAFYWAPTRAWELLIGSIIALKAIPRLKSNFNRNILSGLGLCLIIYSVCFYTEATIFPGLNALSPVIGASLIIYSGIGGEGSISKFLSFKPLVYIGLISYSLYLWHWPLFAFTRYFLLRELTIVEIIVIIFVTVIISAFSLRFIEQPFRGNQPIIPDRNHLFVFSGIIMIAASLIGVMISIENGMPYRYPEANAAIMRVEQRDPEWGKSGEILIEKIRNSGTSRTLIGMDGKTPCFIVWGDSHAQALLPGISSRAKYFGLSGFAVQGHPPTLGIDIKDLPYSEALRNDAVIFFIKSHPELKTVIIIARWAMYSTGNGYKNELPPKNFKLQEVNRQYSICYSNSDLLKIGLVRVVDALLKLDRKVVLVQDVPDIGFDTLSLYFLSRINRESYSGLLPTLKDYDERNKTVLNIFSELATRPNTKIVHPELMLFDDKGRVIIMGNNNLLYRDDNHLSGWGSDFVATSFDEVFQAMPKKN